MLSNLSRSCKVLCSVALVCLSALTPYVQAQKVEKPDNTRKVVRKVAPKYPPELKRHGIGGVVRLSILVLPNGSVNKVSTLGGNPALADAATLAVKQWKYVPADSPTTADVQFDFVPGKD